MAFCINALFILLIWLAFAELRIIFPKSAGEERDSFRFHLAGIWLRRLAFGIENGLDNCFGGLGELIPCQSQDEGCGAEGGVKRRKGMYLR